MNEFQIVAKFSGCRVSGTREEGFGKLHIKVPLTQGYPREKMRLLGLSISGVTSLQGANGDEALDAVAFSRLE